MLATGCGHEGIVKQLLARSDVQVNLADKEGWSALMLAAGHDHEGIAKLLLDLPHINTSLETIELGATAMSIALGEGHSDIVRLLHKYESQLSWRVDSGHSYDFKMDLQFLESAIDEDTRSVAASSEESDVYYDAEEGAF
ncbi:hypothetical protein BKA70DRAFT_1336178 [Coprinopsis sp. MPI-PUGE-AT-0042]|nr:hypothetical protein BKA70DRAFT_1336178 [Coprinopsis sp. MPI-PUGE-AT-0042]